MRRVSLSFAAAVFAGAVVVAVAGIETRSGAQAPIPTVTVGPAVPADIPGGAPSAQLAQAAAFAWQEFIALNWAAVPQTGLPNTRDTPDTTCAFDDPACASRPRVWETFRSKLEIFPGNFGTPNGYSASAPDFGYDAAPAYNYNVAVAPCGGQATPVPTAWVNLDESDQITIDSMFAGIGPKSSTINSDPQMIRFLAKANRTEYDYASLNKWWISVPSSVVTATKNYLASATADPTPAPSGVPATTVSLPYGTIEMKAGWRVLTDAEMKSGRFHTATARYYEFVYPPGKPRTYCWHQATFGLVALHVIQKTPTAPYFVYATFEQADNIQTPQGKAVENDDGSIANAPVCPSGQASPCPTTPLEVLVDGSTPLPNSTYPPNIALATPSAAYCTANLQTRPTNQLYYLEEGAAGAQPTSGFVCVNGRQNPIPQTIVDVNHSVQGSIVAYEKAHGFATPSPLTHYKLVNVQYVPYDNPQPGPFAGNDPTTSNNPASFYLANIVVETNRSLQLFNGGLVNSLVQGQYQGRFESPPTMLPGNPTHKQTLYAGHAYNMGGCMGCHGSQGQNPAGQAGNFSVILARGGANNQFPEPPAPIATTGAQPVPRNRMIVSH
ncbi:MAG: hypothetical protein JWO85_1838 [Candidatus Eremiobacteraeota bacterium]|nr:hypothetical protein [Candidatus Eremiobacteraeota bacterium]